MMKNINLKPADAAPVIVGCLAIVVVAGHAPVPLRALLTFGFSGICPGLAAVSTFARLDRLERIVIAVALSLALDTIVTELLAVRHEFTALTSLVVLTVLMIGKLAFTACRVDERLRRMKLALPSSGMMERLRRMKLARSSQTSDVTREEQI